MPRPERPLESDGSPLVEFAADLRRLREKAGKPPYRELARRVHYSSTTLADAAGGRRVPSLAVAMAYVRACGGDVTQWERRWHGLAAEPAVAAETPRGEERAPYRGLASYQVGDQEWFFGRERLAEELVTRVDAVRFVAVFGPSGAGKSSLLRAGLVPRLMARASTRVAVLTPGANPTEECAIQLARLLGGSPGTIADELAADPRNLHRLVRQAFVSQPSEAEVVLVVDQFEEVFTLCRDAEERSRLIAALVGASEAAGSRCRVVLGVRADFYPHCLSHGDLTARLRDGQVGLGPMSVDELRRAVVLPARRAGCTVETSLLATLVAKAHDRAGVLPLLSHALLETWRHRRGNTLTLDGFHRAGGIDGALVRSAEAVFTSLGEDERDAAKDLFLRLVALGEGTEDTGRRVRRDELDGETTTLAVVDKLTAARLVVVTGNHVEITHEVLIRAWPRLRNWLEEDRHALRVHRELTGATAVWQEHRGDPGTLLRGARLAMVAEWARRFPRTTEAERAFLKASIAFREHEHRTGRRRARLTRALAGLLVVLLVVTTTVVVYAMRTEQTAMRQRDTAAALAAAREAANLVGANPVLAAQLSLAAYRLHPSQATRDTLITAAAAASATQLDTPGTPAAFSLAPNGRLSAAASPVDDVTVLSTISGRVVRPIAEIRGGYLSARFSPDSQLVATVDENAVASVWDVSSPTLPRLLAAVPGRTVELWFSPDNSLLLTTGAVATGSREGVRWREVSGRLWDLGNIARPREIATFALPEVAVFGEDRSLFVAEYDYIDNSGRVALWDLTTPAKPRLSKDMSKEPSEGILGAAFIEDERLLVTTDITGALALWRTDITGRFLRHATTRRSGDATPEVVVSPNDQRVATADLDGVVTLWAISTPSSPTKLIELANSGDSTFKHLTFSQNGRILQGLKEIPETGTTSLVRWYLDADQSAAAVCDGTPAMDEVSWKAYFGEIPYRSSCG